MYPIYAAIIRLLIFALLTLFVVVMTKKIYSFDNVVIKIFSAILLVAFICLTVYISFFSGNVYKWCNNDSEQLVEKVLSIAGADLSSYDNDFNEDIGLQKPIVYISKQKAESLNGKQERENSALNNKNKCLSFNGNDYSIFIEPAIGTRFLTTPTGMYESDIHVYIGNEYIILHIIESQKYTFLQPLMFTSPKVENIYDLLNCAEIRKELQ